MVGVAHNQQAYAQLLYFSGVGQVVSNLTDGGWGCSQPQLLTQKSAFYADVLKIWDEPPYKWDKLSFAR
ncbi:hypothetical protein DTQ70_19475 [Runella sp. SP2]|nr:hypothetical protein DTQ70_19475 [Runella sp. SP2]